MQMCKDKTINVFYVCRIKEKNLIFGEKMNMHERQPQRCIHEKVCRSITKIINEIPGKLAFLKCEDLGWCQFFEEQSEREKVLDLLDDLRKYANGEYNEAELSDNEHDMRIHLEYQNKIWGIMKEIRQSKEDKS